jgi:hypothetical protein
MLLPRLIGKIVVEATQPGLRRLERIGYGFELVLHEVSCG